MSWVGSAYCEYCKQLVDVYTEDCITFECGFCGKPIQFDFEDYVEKRSEFYIEDYLLEEGLKKYREGKEKNA